MDIISKRVVSLTELLALSTFSAPFQRVIDEDRVQDICTYQMRVLANVGCFLFLSDLILSDMEGRYYVLDGQHRLEAIRRVYCHSPTSKIGITLVKPNVHFSLRDAFQSINMSTPVPEYVLSFAEDDATRHRLLVFRAAFVNRYKPFISKAKTPVRPNINVDDFLDRLYKCPRLFGRNLSADELMAFVSFVNVTKLSTRSGPIAVKAVEKAKKYKSEPLFLTIDAPEYTCLDRNDYFHDFMTSRCTARTGERRKPLSKPLRSCVWKSAFGSSMSGTCVCCTRAIEYDSFECGHIVSVHNGGGDSAANLRPVCGLCNKSMGIDNMNDFCSRNGFPVFS